MGYNEDVDKLQPGKKKKKTVQKIKRCRFPGCPMNADHYLQEGGLWACCFHNNSDFHKEVTRAIVNNIQYVKWYSAMVKWNGATWKKETHNLANKEFPLLPGQCRSIYLHEFYNWIEQKILNEATEYASELPYFKSKNLSPAEVKKKLREEMYRSTGQLPKEELENEPL